MNEDTPVYLFFDPGMTTGWAIYTEKGEYKISGQCYSAHLENFLNVLRATYPNIIEAVREEVWIFPGRLGKGLQKVISLLEKYYPQSKTLTSGMWKTTVSLHYKPADPGPFGTHALDAIRIGHYWLHVKNKKD